MATEGDVKFVWAIREPDPSSVVPGRLVVYALCESKTTAERCAIARPDSVVKKVEAIFHDGFWCGPMRLIESSTEDNAKDAKEAKIKAVIDKCLAAGITEEDLKVLGYKA